MDLTTQWLGLNLPHPFMPGASPLVDDLDDVRRLEDAGAAAIVMHSLFEEQLVADRTVSERAIERQRDLSAEAGNLLPGADEFALGPEAYLEQIRRIRAAVDLPVIASLNGSTPAGWLEYAKLIEQAGASALELNVYHVATDPGEDGASVEKRALESLRIVRGGVRIPVAVKLSPFYSSPARLARDLGEAGADGLVLFNRFYQPDIDVENLSSVPKLALSDSSELLLRLRWIAILAGRVRPALAVSGGVHSAADAVKAIMAGASAVQMVSALLRHGIGHLRTVREETARWMEAHEYESLRQMRASLSLARTPDPAAYERANYVRLLQSWRS